MSGKDILVSTFASFVIVALVGVLALPVIYPNIQEQSTTPSDVDTDFGIVLQSKYMEVSTQSGINDGNNDTYVNIPDTQIKMTTSNNSKIVAMFNAPFLIGVGPNVISKRFIFGVSLVIEGVGNRTIRLSTWNSGTTSSYYEYSSTMTINYVTSVLPAGNYTINVKYISFFSDPSHFAYLTLSVPNINNTRSLWVLETR